MADGRILRSIVKKCDFLYDYDVLSKEKIINKYLKFFAGRFDPSGRSVNYVFHTGSICFDIVSVAALLIGCLAYEFSSNDEILADLGVGDMVLFKGKRYHWEGIKKLDKNSFGTDGEYIILRQDAKGKNGDEITYLPYEQYKHLIRPYYGESSVTDGRGIRREIANRNDFIAHILEISVADVPSSLDISVVVVADKNEFLEICNNLIIRYDGYKAVRLTDVVPVSYYSGSGEQFQIGKNPSKAEAVIKVTGKLSVARDLVLDKHGNRVIGLMVLNSGSYLNSTSELNDLLRRKSLKFAFVLAPFNSEACELAMEQYESANIFACTKEMMSGERHEVKESNMLTRELNRQISNILTHNTSVIRVNSFWGWEDFKKIKDKIYSLKQSNWSGEDRDTFLLSALALINLFSSSFFSMNQMENAVSSGEINRAVVSPGKRIEELLEIASRTASMQDRCAEIANSLLEMYVSLSEASPKEAALREFLTEHKFESIVIVVPKAYYAEIFAETFENEFKNVLCVTANRFDNQWRYDRIIVTGDIIGKKFDALQCFSVPEITMFLYEFEEKTFSYRKKKSKRTERKLIARIKGIDSEEYLKALETADDSDTDISDVTVREFSDLDEFVASLGVFDIRKLAVDSSGSEYSGTAEVKFVGTFTTGDQILFSKYYSAVVFNEAQGTVTETSPDKLLPGDILVFTKRNDYTSNIVDQIFEQLMSANKLSAEVQDAAEKAFYWKNVLREYKEMNNLKYSDLARELKSYGSSMRESTVRQWLMEESHVIGPRNVETMKTIAKVTQDSYLLEDPEAYFNACRVVRHYRREILSLIAQAINDKLSNKEPIHGSEFEIIYDNVDKLSETMELENVYELDEYATVSIGIVNHPISESEVLM